MKVLVIGGSGQDGILVSALLLSLGHHVVSVSRRPSPLAKVESEIADIAIEGVASALVRKHRPDHIYYLAAFHRSSEAAAPEPVDELDGCLRVHLSSFVETLSAAVKYCPGTRIAYASSCRIFGLGDGGLLDETAPRAPVCPYGVSKAAGMGAAGILREDSSLFVCSAILFNHESELRPPGFVSRKLVLAALRALKDRESIVKVGSLDAVSDWGSARDYARAMVAMLEGETPRDYVVASGELRTVRDLASECFSAFGLDWRPHVREEASLSLGRPWRLRGDSSLLRAETGWRPRQDFREMVSDIVTRTQREETNGQRSSDFHSYL